MDPPCVGLWISAQALRRWHPERTQLFCARQLLRARAWVMRHDDAAFLRSVLASVVADDEDKFGSSRVPTPKDAAEKIVGFMVVKYKGPRSRVKITAYDAEVRCQLNTMAARDGLKELHLHDLTQTRCSYAIVTWSCLITASAMHLVLMERGCFLSLLAFSSTTATRST